MSINTKNVFLGLIMCFLGSYMFAQTTVSGNITDAENGETLIGANILVKGTVKGTITDYDGHFDLEVNQDPPFTLVISLIGYGSQEVEIVQNNQDVTLALDIESFLANEIVVSASRVEESIMQSPVSIEKIGIQQIKASAAPDFYDEINNMKGVIRTQASLTFNTINTRGFATAGNTRFVQLQDGMDNAAPLLNFPTGNIVGISELDIKDVELVPGAASALYGPNAFNGILFMNSKDPWNYQELSAQLKSGFTQSQGESNPLYGFSLRYADDINDKFAYKFNVSTFFAEDWKADNYDEHLVSALCPTGNIRACFNGTNTYGDETAIPLGDNEAFITRSGFNEQDLLDNNDAKSIKLDGALHYRISDNLEANASYKWGSGSSVYQGAERYALRDFIQQFAKFELNAANWNLRAYGSFTDDGDSYNLSALGAFVNEGTWQSLTSDDIFGLPAGWAVAANIAYSGNLSVFGVPGGDATAAKSFANAGGMSIYDDLTRMAFAQAFASSQGLPLAAGVQFVENISGNAALKAGTPEFEALVEQVRTGLFQKGGAGFIDNSRLYHAEGNYDFSEAFDNKIGLQVGANVRRYSLFTDGTVFREFNEETGQNERININEYGGYMQLSKSITDALKLTGSIRYDKNENFDGQFSPRVAAVYSLGEGKKHNFRASWQTGFRNPSTQGQYIFFPASQVLLGGTKSNADITNEIDGSNFNIFEDGVLALDGTTMVNLEYVKPEKLTAFEIGYKSILGSDLFLDINFYRNQYKDFISQLSVLSTKDLVYLGNSYGARGRWFPYTNVPIEFNSNGIDLGFRYRINRDWSVNGNYSYASLDFDEAKLVGTSFEGSGFDPGFNTPENKIGIGVQAKNVIDNLGLGINFRWQDEFFYSSSFGAGTIPSFQTVDASLSYRVKSLKSLFKLGVTNLLEEEYVTNVGNPTIGRTIVLTITYDQFAN